MNRTDAVGTSNSNRPVRSLNAVCTINSTKHHQAAVSFIITQGIRFKSPRNREIVKTGNVVKIVKSGGGRFICA
jgi:hypothetical protein